MLLDELIRAIAGRLGAEGAEDLSDDELKRCLSGCALPTKLLATAKTARDNGALTMDMVNGAGLVE